MAWRLRKGAARAWLIGLGTLAALVLTLMLLLAWLLASESGRLTLLDQVEHWLPRLTGQTLVIEGARSPALGDWRFERLSWQQGSGALAVDSRNLSLQWRPRYLWQRRIWLDALNADTLDVTLPASSADDTAGSGAASSLPDIAEFWSGLPSARLDELHIERLSLRQGEKPELGTAVSGDLAINWGAWPARLELSFTDRRSQLNLAVNVDAVAALRVRGDLDTAADSAWADWLDWPLQQPLAGRWDLELSQRQGRLEARIDELTLPWRDQRLVAQGGVSLNPANRRLFFSELEIAAGEQSARLHGYVQPERADLSVTADALPLALARPWLPVKDLDGAITVDGRLSGGWRTPRFAGSASFEGRWRDEALRLNTRSSASTGALSIEQLALQWGPASLSADGRIDWANQQLDLAIDARHLADRHWRPWVPAWPDDIRINDANLSGRISGSLGQPQLNAEVDAEGSYREQPLTLTAGARLNRSGLNLDDIELSSQQGRVDGSLDIDFASATLVADSRFSDVHSDWLPVFGAQLPGNPDWVADAQLNWNGPLRNPEAQGTVQVEGRWLEQPLSADLAVSQLDLRQLQLGDSRLRLGDASSGLAGRIDWAGRRLDLAATPTDVRLASIRPFVPPWPTWLDSLSGRLDGQLSVNGPWNGPQLSGDLALTGQWQEQALNARLQLQADQRQRWQIDQAQLDWAGTRLYYSGWLAPFERSLDGDFSIDQLSIGQLRELGITLPEALADLDGLANARGRISGDLTRPTLNDAGFNFNGQYARTELSAQARLRTASLERVDVEQLQFSSGPAQWSLAGQIGLQPLTLDIRTELQQLDWDRVRPWVPTDIGVPLTTLSGQLSGQLSARGDWPRLALDGSLEAGGRYLDSAFQLNWAGDGQLAGRLKHSLSLSWGDSRLNGQLDSEGEQLDGQLRISKLDIDQIRALGAPLEEGVSGDINADLGVSGTLMDPRIALQLNAAGRWQPVSIGLTDSTDWRIDIDGQGRRDDWQLSRAEADLGPAGWVSLGGRGSKDELRLDGEVRIDDSRYWLADRPEWSGALTGDFQLAGSAEQPQVEAALDWQSDRWPLMLSLNLATEAGEHRLAAQLTENNANRLSVNASTPQTPLAEWQRQPTARPFAAELFFDTDSTVFEPFFQGRPDQDFSGELSGRLSIEGSLARPQWAGEVSLADGRYENATYGTVLSGMSGELSADNRTLQLDLEAGDDVGGRVGLAGSVVWPEDRDYWWMPELDLAMTTRSARLLRRADMDASVSGELSVTGPWRDLIAAGNLEVSPLTIQLNSLLQSGAPSLNVVSAERLETPTDEDAEPRLLAPQGQWQVRLRANRRAQIYGQGLEAELSGELDLSDELTRPEVGGRFQVIRGTYTAFGKIFQITDGNIQVQGSQIVLDIQATYTGPDLSVNLRVTGTQDQLNLALSSSPPLANDELLARLLFGTTLNEMTAVQAFQLATALNSLRDPNSGLDLFGTTRELLGLDSLSLDSDTNEAGETGVNVQAGKYLSDRLYLQVESGVRTEQNFAGSLQFQVTPQVNLELYTNGQFGSGGLELNWSEDY